MAAPASLAGRRRVGRLHRLVLDELSDADVLD
jgi:hypothetical protein